MDNPLTSDRLKNLLDQFPSATVLVVGDFFLDNYLIIAPELAEISLETGLTAHQIVDIRTSPGAAGTVTANLRALEVNVIALGIFGNDGYGFDLIRKLQLLGVDTTSMLRLDDRFTPTYTKPMRRLENGSLQEMERLDMKNHHPLPAAAEETLIARLREWLPQVDAVVISDQVPETDCGVITTRLRTELSALAQRYPAKPFLADSRTRIGQFSHITLKPNRTEALCAAGCDPDSPADLHRLSDCGSRLYRQAQRPVFITMGAEGLLLCAGETAQLIPTITVSGPLDIVGAGDSTTAGIIAALCAGATLPQAAMVGNLVASITIQQLGTTGTATRSQVQARFEEIGSRE